MDKEAKQLVPSILPNVWTDYEVELTELRAKCSSLYKALQDAINELCAIRDRLYGCTQEAVDGSKRHD